MAYINGHIPNYTEQTDGLYKAQLKAEADFYKALAESYAQELRNIPASIEQYGEWTYESDKGETVKLIKRVGSKPE